MDRNVNVDAVGSNIPLEACSTCANRGSGWLAGDRVAPASRRLWPTPDFTPRPRRRRGAAGPFPSSPRRREHDIGETPRGSAGIVAIRGSFACSRRRHCADADAGILSMAVTVPEWRSAPQPASAAHGGSARMADAIACSRKRLHAGAGAIVDANSRRPVQSMQGRISHLSGGINGHSELGCGHRGQLVHGRQLDAGQRACGRGRGGHIYGTRRSAPEAPSSVRGSSWAAPMPARRSCCRQRPRPSARVAVCRSASP